MKTYLHHIVIRYLDGEATVSERAMLLREMRRSPGFVREFADIRRIYEVAGRTLSGDVDIDTAFERMKARIVRRNRRIRLMRRIAAVAAATTFFALNLHHQPTDLAREKTMQQCIAEAGASKKQLQLSDGTAVWLNAYSSLVYPDSFAADSRVVELRGEGYFEVAEDKSTPFVVKAGDMSVSVHGTRFNVRSKETGKSEVALLSGAVEVSGDAIPEPVNLKPNEVLSCKPGETAPSVAKADASYYADWTKDSVHFDNTRLADIIVSMEARYQVRIDCPSALADTTRLTFTICNEDIKDIMGMLRLIAPLDLELADHKMTIKERQV